MVSLLLRWYRLWLKTVCLACLELEALLWLETEKAILTLKERLGDLPFGVNLLHSPQEPALEDGTVDLMLKHEVRTASASAYIDLTLPIVRYRVMGIRRLEDGTVYAPNRVIGKVSRIEVATRFFSPPPEKHVATLVAQGIITAEQGEMAKEIPMGQDIIAEADSGGHTDNQPFVTMVPTMIALRDQMQARYNYPLRLRVGVGGGIGTPVAAAAAFIMGAAFLVTGSVNQSCKEAGTSQAVREMLCQTQQADTTMAPAADMFEMGVQVQVLKRGTMFPMRAKKLYEVYRDCGSIEEISPADRANMEKTMFKTTLEDIWNQTQAYFKERDKRQLDRALREPKYKMALIFRWYLGQTSHWATSGEASRRVDFQVQCGPAMGAFNEWAKGTVLEKAENREVANVSMNLLRGASYLTRTRGLAYQGVGISSELSVARPVAGA